MNSQKLFDAFEELDADLVYDAHAKPHIKRYAVRRIALAAAVFTIILSSAVIFAVFTSPVATIWLECRESAVITLNSRGNVLSAGDRQESVGKPAADVIALITEEMLESGALNENENTLLFGVGERGSALKEQLCDSITAVFKKNRFDGCLIALECENATDKEHRQNQARSSVIKLLTDNDDALSKRDLQKLSCNDLGLLLSKCDKADEITVIGTPSEKAYIGFDKAVERATSISGFGENEMSGIDISYSVYHGKLIYLVRLNAGQKSEAYFINAQTGSIEQAIKAPSAHIESLVREAIDTPAHPVEPTQAVNPTASPTDASITEATASPPFDAVTEAILPPAESYSSEAETSSADADQPTEALAGSADYTTVPITLKELNFVVTTPPDNAGKIEFQTLFEGQSFEERHDERNNTGEVAVITDYSQFQAFLKKHPHAFSDRTGSVLKTEITKDFFNTRYLFASACTISDASCYTTVTALSTDGEKIYMENSRSYGAARSGEFYCHTLSLYAVDRSAASPDSSLIVY